MTARDGTPDAAGGATPSAVDVAVRCRDVSVARRDADGQRVRVVDGVTVTVPRGAAVAVLGTTGSGKSSLLRALAGQGDRRLALCGGSAQVCGIPIGRRGRAQRRLTYAVGFLGQGDATGLPVRLTASETIGSPITGRDRGVNRRALALRVADLLDELGLPLGVADKYPYELSAGMRHRVALARALVLRPAVLAADGLFAHLDVRARGLVAAAVQRRRQAYGMTLLLAGNDPASARLFHAGALVLHGAHPVAVGPSVDALRWTPDTPAALRGLVSS